jgi:hypothetical protein
VVVVGICTAVGLLGLGALAGARLTRDCSFSRETWAAGRDLVKFEVLEHDLELAVDCGTLKDASPTRVERLLGDPDTKSDSVWSYDVGVPATLSDYPDFELRFGDTGCVEDAQVPDYIQ